MASIYTCPACRRRYTIQADGCYLCECGKEFAFPPVLSREKACFIQAEIVPTARLVQSASQPREPEGSEAICGRTPRP